MVNRKIQLKLQPKLIQLPRLPRQRQQLKQLHEWLNLPLNLNHDIVQIV